MAPAETRLRRLVELRGTPEAAGRKRMAAQATCLARLAVSNHVVTNVGDLDALRSEVDRIWFRLAGGPAVE